MARERKLQFPEGFLWGTASSAHQCEGGNVNNQWYRWEQQGRTLTGERSAVAANWWQQAERDFELAEQMENNALRLSLEWSRIEPEEGRWDESALERYRVLLSDLRRRHMTPLVTLHHFTDPLWFADRDGFAREENIRYFVRFVRFVVEHLRDLCSFWLTINEPNVYAFLGYLTGEFPPGEQRALRALHVLRNLMAAHVQAFYAIRELQPEGQIGYCLNYRLLEAACSYSPLDRVVAGLQETFFNWLALKLAEGERLPLPLRFALSAVPRAAGARDYHGINYYTRDLVAFDPRRPGELFGRRFPRPGAPMQDPGRGGYFGEVYPEGLYRVLHSVYRSTRGNKPLYVTEHGLNDVEDRLRPRAILEHLAMLHRAIREGLPVRGYFHWTLVDNFEWNEGWGAHFGLVELNPRTQERRPRPSASMFGEICRANAITESIVERYAPEAAATIFGPVTAAGSGARVLI
ncbi:MAG: glycoside hydrolase family 1 protein [Thermogemmatispora sp.]|jgi:beta-glucosidase|uniref:Beta-glucosidase n=1 Tax=Thermogemmatispora aurantia TaxID=2045279 RepID=A0A5J4K526_9CHLR|nr:MULTISPECIES: glycoside hydrolase family 1 protein [Thermogemmatispora]MBE3564800.1 glycoside hydrolase family 1 protein [Thermogemmatispora sp.]GER81851.1 beta-glucosidase [Thermogemmatispora aurantia]